MGAWERLKRLWRARVPATWGNVILVAVIGVIVSAVAQWPVFLWGQGSNKSTENLTELVEPFTEAVNKLGVRIEDLESALKRVIDAGADDVIAALRRDGDAKLLLAFLVEERDRTADAMPQRNQEIAIVAYAQREIAIAEDAARRLLAADPENLFGLTILGQVLRFHGKLTEAEVTHRKVLKLARLKGEDWHAARAQGNLSLVYLDRGDYNKAEEMLVATLAAFREMEDPRGIADARMHLGVVYDYQERFEEAAVEHRAAIVLYKALNNQIRLATEYANLGVVYQNQGKLDAAAEYHRKARDINEVRDNQEGLARDLANLGFIAKERRRLDEAEVLLARSLKIFDELDHPYGMAACHEYLGEVDELKGDLASACKHWVLSQELYAKAEMVREAERIQQVREQKCTGKTGS